MTVSNELIDRLLADYKKPEDLIGENGLLKQLTKRLVERALEAEMAEHLGHGKNEPVANPKGNTRNGKSKKTLKGEFGELPIEIPRDRDGSFEPQIVPKHQTRWTGFDDKILSMYARGMTVREIQAHLEEMYGAEVSPTLISTVTDAVMDEAKAWQSRPLDALYPIVYLDCIHVKSRDAGVVKVKAVYLALGIDLMGNKQLLGLWIAPTFSAYLRGLREVEFQVPNNLKILRALGEFLFQDVNVLTPQFIHQQQSVDAMHAQARAYAFQPFAAITRGFRN